MILVDTGPFIALFDPKNSQRSRCKEVLQGIHPQPLRLHDLPNPSRVFIHFYRSPFDTRQTANDEGFIVWRQLIAPRLLGRIGYS